MTFPFPIHKTQISAPQLRSTAVQCVCFPWLAILFFLCLFLLKCDWLKIWLAACLCPSFVWRRNVLWGTAVTYAWKRLPHWLPACAYIKPIPYRWILNHSLITVLLCAHAFWSLYVVIGLAYDPPWQRICLRWYMNIWGHPPAPNTSRLNMQMASSHTWTTRPIQTLFIACYPPRSPLPTHPQNPTELLWLQS